MHDRKARSLERWFHILTVLMGGGRPTADDLARRFGVTRRTIFRDIAALEEQRIPVVRDGGHYAIMDTYRVKPIQFQPHEVLALAAALDFARRSRPLGGAAAVSALEKLRAVLPAAHQELAAGLDETLVVDPLQGHSLPAPPEVEEALRAGLQGPHPVRIRYQALAAEAASERVVRPYGLAYRGTGLYLIGFCELRQEIRTFRANRILAATVLPATFARPAGFDLERYLADIWGIEDGPTMQVQVRFYPPVARLARETVWHPTQRVHEEPGGSVIVSMETRGKNELARWLSGYGGTVEVLGPPELREAVRSLGQAIVDRYTN
ncbi:MAG: helix-turn-helix transcriptional regulator [Bacillota bacterium]